MTAANSRTLPGREREGSSCVSGGYKLEFAAIAFTASTYKRWREQGEIPPQVSVTQEFKVILAK